ncbi:uncharacterized protein LOC133745383 [Rosa rugosa]|uniref:uncharacterized protein LOC133745383 n=1 Tax=Rosa rugosa TaxID=74645 RepID=UPI002B40F402|nr:uncharacterized protein LOC133745383 [Rosa rugosa]XP_062029426.1 uncharacterized protein LOC133745383 [Rosa rugosa]XP_062029427.1 uncharacterized protein LOC133745383 [Rosa rugosa]XP_062029428.1 uncharacterized protein LOC133745383 [Rosa rugosa]
MLDLFLSEPNWKEDDSAEMRVSLLNKLESVIWSLMASGGRSEARLWLCNTIAGISSITHHHQRELFIDLLRSKPLKKRLATQLLHMIFDNRPQKAGSVIAKRSYALRKFFQGNPTRISQWFSKTGSGLRQGQGSNALSQFAFVNRDNCWEELEWKGKHGQSPAVVATKPHYFLDLDVQQTVENFLENVPEFWSSNEFSESLKGGEILIIDRNFFVLYFLDLMYKEDARDVWEVTNEFLEEERFSSLCKHLLITLEESDLCDFLKMLHKHVKPTVECKDPMDSSYLFEVVVSRCSNCGCFDQILLLNAVFNYGRQLLRLLRDEGAPEDQARLQDTVSEICAIPGSENSMAPIIKGGSKLKTIEAFKLMGLQSWVLFFSLSEKCQTPQSWESLFFDNEISFRKYDKYSFIHDDEVAEEGGSDLDYRGSKKVKRRKKTSSRRKRRRHFDHDDNELLDFDATNNRLDLHSSVGSWLLSLDGYSASWNSADLPEYLSKYCLSTWMKWALAQWDQ